MSLRARLVAGMAVVAVVLCAAAVVITNTTEAFLLDRVDDQLEAAGTSGRRVDRGRRPKRDDPPSNAYVGVVEPDGTLRTLASPNLTGEERPPPALPDGLRVDAADGRSRPRTVGTDPPSDSRYRIIAQVEGRSGELRVLGLPLDDVEAARARLIRVEVLATLCILALLGLVTSWVLRLGVRPIKAMTATATAIAAGDLSRRAPPAPPGSEASELGAALNRMLTRIEEAFEQRARSEDRLRRFVADASHELRTPVTTIRGYAELYRSGGLADRDELRSAMSRTEQEALRMGRLVDELLLLARLDQGRPLEQDAVDLRAIAADTAADARAVDAGRRISTDLPAPVVVVGDEERLRQVMANLVSNAFVHTPAGTPVHVRVAAIGDRAVVEVRDEGPGMEPEVAAQVFERFYRADPSRTRSRGGTGLGLAIVHAIVDAHGGTIDLRSAPGQGTRVRMELPLAGGDPGGTGLSPARPS